MEWLLERMSGFGSRPAFVWRGETYSYDWLCAESERCAAWLARSGVSPGTVVSLESDYSPHAVALLLALILRRAIVVPLSSWTEAEKAVFRELGQVQVALHPRGEGEWELVRTGALPDHPLVRQLRELGEPGLVLFSSGSTGASKGVVHSFARLLEKFRVERRPVRAPIFLLLDHIGGINTLFHFLSSGSLAVATGGRDPETLCRAIDEYRLDLLPVSPSFLNLLLVSEAYRGHDLSSLKRISYGSEVMPEATLQRLREQFPGVELLQMYGLSELGILQARSRDEGSLWIRLQGDGYETKVVDGTLRIRSRSAMLGYLNAPNPFDAEGWFDTEDAVEVDGEWLRVLGRRSEIINVGGEKVYPAEVESVLMEMSNVRDAVVAGEPNPLLGATVVAALSLAEPEEPAALRRRVREFCRDRLAAYKIPTRIRVVEGSDLVGRVKKVRRVEA